LQKEKSKRQQVQKRRKLSSVDKKCQHLVVNCFTSHSKIYINNYHPSTTPFVKSIYCWSNISRID